MHKIKTIAKPKQAGLTNAIAHKIILEYDDVLNLKEQFSSVLQAHGFTESAKDDEIVKDQHFNQSLAVQRLKSTADCS